MLGSEISTLESPHEKGVLLLECDTNIRRTR